MIPIEISKNFNLNKDANIHNFQLRANCHNLNCKETIQNQFKTSTKSNNKKNKLQLMTSKFYNSLYKDVCKTIWKMQLYKKKKWQHNNNKNCLNNLNNIN